MNWIQPSLRRMFTLARIVLAVAVAAVLGNLYLLLNDALDSRKGSAQYRNDAWVEALRGHQPGEPPRRSAPKRWVKP